MLNRWLTAVWLVGAADGDEGGRHALISAAVSGGNLYLCKIQVGDKRCAFCYPAIDLPSSLVVVVIVIHRPTCSGFPPYYVLVTHSQTVSACELKDVAHLPHYP